MTTTEKIKALAALLRERANHYDPYCYSDHEQVGQRAVDKALTEVADAIEQIFLADE
jgi:hypothetical protein